MVLAIISGVGSCGLLGVWRRWRVARANDRDSQNLELLAAVILYEEMTAAMGALDLALRNEDPKWLASMSESRTLSEAWHEHAGDLKELTVEHWAVLSDAVTAMAPSHRIVPGGTRTNDLRPSLARNRELLAEGADILRALRDR